MNKTLSLIVPVYFEKECIERFIAETQKVLLAIGIDYEMVFIDDGSTDGTPGIIRRYATQDQRIKLIEFSYNHGKQAAVSAGIHYATGDYLLYMDPDLQDPPDEIPRFLAEIDKGYDVVYGVRKEKKDSLLNTLFSKLFWWVLAKFTQLRLPKGLAVMRMFSRRFAEKFLQYPEQNRFIEGIFMHIGMRQTTLTIEQAERFAGVSKFTFKKKMKLAFDAILDFSDIPLKMAVSLGATLAVFGFLAMLMVLVLKLTFVDFQAGWPSVLSVLLTGFGLQLFFTGIAALYIGRIYLETKRRPLFSIKDMVNVDSGRLAQKACEAAMLTARDV
jgi:glycosyltransferase involved in cell wall biosynthesis